MHTASLVSTTRFLPYCEYESFLRIFLLPKLGPLIRFKYKCAHVNIATYSIQTSLVCLIQNDDTVVQQFWIVYKLSQKTSIGEVFDFRA